MCPNDRMDAVTTCPDSSFFFCRFLYRICTPEQCKVEAMFGILHAKGDIFDSIAVQPYFVSNAVGGIRRACNNNPCIPLNHGIRNMVTMTGLKSLVCNGSKTKPAMQKMHCLECVADQQMHMVNIFNFHLLFCIHETRGHSLCGSHC